MSEQAEYYYLKKGEIIQEGDEVEMSANYNDDAKWVRASSHTIGSQAPDPLFMAHRVYRRRIGKSVGQVLQEKADNARDERVVSALLKADTKGLSKAESTQKLKNVIQDTTEC